MSTLFQIFPRINVKKGSWNNVLVYTITTVTNAPFSVLLVTAVDLFVTLLTMGILGAALTTVKILDALSLPFPSFAVTSTRVLAFCTGMVNLDKVL